MTLSDTFFANTFPQIVACLFSLLTVSLEMQEILNLMKRNLSIFLIDWALLYWINICNIRLTFYSLGFIFRPIIHFEINFVFGGEYSSKCIYFWRVDIHFFLALYVGEAVLYVLYSLCIFVQSFCPRICSLLLDYLFYPFSVCLSWGQYYNVLINVALS